MHAVDIGQDILNRVLARRGRVHLFDALDPARCALVVVDMQNTFVEPGAPAEVPMAREVVPGINELARAVRGLGVRVIWVTHANRRDGLATDWRGFFDHIVGDPEKIAAILDNMEPGAHGTLIWRELKVDPADLRVSKNRYSAFTSGASQIERLLRGFGIETLILAGTKTNVCVESTGRDAMMLDFNAVLVSDCCAALTDREHLATLETFIQQFGDVMTKDEVLALFERKRN